MKYIFVNRSKAAYSLIFLFLCSTAQASFSRPDRKRILFSRNLHYIYYTMLFYEKNHPEILVHPVEEIEKITTLAGPDIKSYEYSDICRIERADMISDFSQFILFPFVAILVFFTITGNMFSRRRRLLLFSILISLAILALLCAPSNIFKPSLRNYLLMPEKSFKYVNDFVYVPDVPIDPSKKLMLAYEKETLVPEGKYIHVLYSDGSVDVRLRGELFMGPGER